MATNIKCIKRGNNKGNNNEQKGNEQTLNQQESLRNNFVFSKWYKGQVSFFTIITMKKVLLLRGLERTDTGEALTGQF